jgi:alginate O-acetyltransferase complex protein AlgI
MKGMLLLFILLTVEITNQRWSWNVSQLQRPALRIALFVSVLWLIALFGTFSANSFIYFQF